MARAAGKRFCWTAENTPEELHGLLRALAEHYPVVEGRRRGAMAVRFIAGAKAGCVDVSLKGAEATVRYERPHHAARGLGTLLAGLAATGRVRRETIPFETLGIMLDCSRNAVMTVEHFKGWLRQLALLGFNMAMLYTEDTYALDGEEYLGYLRGRYTADELREIDDYAHALGIEMVACIQTLGHMEQMLRWPACADVRDTDAILLADEEKTYALIDKMIAHWAGVFRSRRIHVGQDEAEDLGRGRHLDRFGFQGPIEVFIRHLGRTVEICRAHGLAPMVWSDMFFKMAGASYRGTEALAIPAKLRRQIPRDLQLVLWDYYNDQAEAYERGIDRHRELGYEPLMASGVWSWHRLWYDRHLTEANVPPCVAACRSKGVREFLFTLWGDDGAYCEFDSALAGLAFGAETVYAGGAIRRADLARRFAAICGADYQAVRAAAELNLPHPNVLWDDPLLGILWKNEHLNDPRVWPKAARRYAGVAKALAKHARTAEPVDLAHAAALAKFLQAKVELLIDLHRAYRRRDAAALKAVRKRTPQVVRSLDAVIAAFRRQWMRRNKPHGLEVIQLRLAAQRVRLLELAQRLGELLDGKVDAIDELDERPGQPSRIWGFRSVASGSVRL